MKRSAALRLEVDGGLGDFVEGGDGFGVGLVAALVPFTVWTERKILARVA